MKAAVIYESGGPEVLRYEDVADPECPDGCVVVDAEAISVEGGDLLARAAGDLPVAPHIVGYLSAGTISEVAAGVQGRAVGDRVVALNAAGSHAARRAVPAAMTWPIPAGLDADRAACVPVGFGTAYECLFTAGNLTEGQTVLIHAGAGGVGMAAIQLAKRAGATVITTASSDEKLKRLKALGITHGINYATESFVERTNQLTDRAACRSSSTRSEGRTSSTASVCSRTGERSSASGLPPVRARRSRRGRSGRATTHCTASFSAARSCRSTPASTP